MGNSVSIPVSELEHYGETAQEQLGREDVSATDYEGLAQEAADKGAFYAAAVYYKLAEAAAAGDADRAMEFARASVEAMSRVTDS